MNILFICENYYPHPGGADLLFKNLAERYVQRGHIVTVLTHLLPGTKQKETINGVQIERVPCLDSRYLFTFLAVKKALQLAKMHDIIQTTSFNGAPPAWLAGKLAGKPVVITVHEVWQGKWKRITGFPWWKSLMHEFLEKAIYMLPYGRYICVSEATKKDLLRTGIPERKAEVIYNGLDYGFWNIQKVGRAEIQSMKKKFGVEKNFLYFSWGRPGVSKGFEYLIRAFPAVAERVPHARLLLMLSASPQYRKKRQELVQLAEKMNKSSNHKAISIIPSLSDRELRTLLVAVDCAVIPSVAEGFGYNSVQAAAMGKPLIVSDAGSLPEVVSGRCHIFRSQDAADLAEKMLLAAEGKWLHAEKKIFSWEKCVEKYLRVYGSLVQGSARGSINK